MFGEFGVGWNDFELFLLFECFLLVYILVIIEFILVFVGLFFEYVVWCVGGVGCVV